MAAVGERTPNRGHGRRRSSIPRPTSSKLLASLTTSPRASGISTTQSGRAIEQNAPQAVVKPRTYSRTRNSSLLHHQNDRLGSFETFRAQPPRLSLSTTTSYRVNSSADVSGTRQQLQSSHPSYHSLASIDAVHLPGTAKEGKKPATSHPSPSRLTKPNNPTGVAEATSPVMAQRQLMGPLGPPIPRSQTTGSLTCFVDAAAANRPSLLTRSPGAVTVISRGNEVGVIGALADSGITANQITNFKEVPVEIETNRQTMNGRIGAIGRVSEDNAPLASSKTMPSLAKLSSSSEPVRCELDVVSIDDNSKKLLFQKADIKLVSDSSFSITPPMMFPDSGVNMGADSDRDSEIDIKLVHSEEPVQYWRGRFSALSDRLRSEEYSIQPVNFASKAFTTGEEPLSTPKIEAIEDFEIDEIHRRCRALEELYSCCRTPAALKSFYVFQRETLAKLDIESTAPQQGQSNRHSADRKAGVLTAEVCSNVLKMNRDGSAETLKTINRKPKAKISMAGSKTIWNMGQPIDAITNGTKGNAAKLGSGRPSYLLKAQDEVMAFGTTIDAARQTKALPAARRNVRTSEVGLDERTGAAKGLDQGITTQPAAESSISHSLPRKSSGAGAGTGTNVDVLKRVFSESVKSVRRMGRSFTGLSGAEEG